MSKIYYEVINTYGKSSGEEVTDSGVIEDSKENREELIDEWSWSGRCPQTPPYFGFRFLQQ